MISFQYSRISDNLIAEITELVLHQGESVTVMGPRYGGKKYVIAHVREELEKAGVNPIVQINLPRQEMVATKDKLFQLITQATQQAVGNNFAASLESDVEDQLEDSFFSPIDQLAKLVKRPVVVIVPYVDGMSHSLARLLLQAIRVRVTERKIIALLSGETDLRELVHGPKSEFNCVNQYVLQGFDLDTFREQAQLYAQALNLRFENEHEAEEYLWRLTGGNIHQLRVLFCGITESRVSRGEDLHRVIKSSAIPQSLYQIEAPGVCRAEVFRQATRLINHEPNCWSDLETLIVGQTVKVQGIDSDAPGPLELAGVAMRDGNELRLASPLMRDFLNHYYTPQRFGDLFAKNGLWEKAFTQYAQLKPEERLRPTSTDDRADVAELVKSLCHSLFAEAAKGVENVKNLFARGSYYVLGFSEISFWQRNGKWVRQETDNVLLARYNDVPPIARVSKDYEKAVGKILPLTNNVPLGLWHLPDTLSQYGAIAILPTLRNDRQAAVTVCNYTGRVVVSRERKLLVEELLKNFVSAYEHAITVEYESQRHEVRDRHLDVINSIFQGLGFYIHDTRQMLTMAARELRNLGYKRVLFCLVDPERKRIQGVVDNADSTLVNVAEATDYPLYDDTTNKQPADLQSYIIYTKRAEIIPDAAKHPLTAKKVVRLATMKAIALVPIINLTGEAIGTIHIERNDDAVPTETEVEDLKIFAQQLAVAVELCERVNLLQSAFDKIPEPVGIADPLQRLLYINKLAGQFLRRPSGWLGTPEPMTAEMIPNTILTKIKESLDDGKPRTQHDKLTYNDKNYNVEIVTAVLKDWRARPVGVLGHIRDLSIDYQLFEAFQLLMGSEATMKSLLFPLNLLGHKWGRLYLVDEKDNDHLISTLSFGFKNPAYEKRFSDGRVELARRGTLGNDSWMSIQKGESLIFCFRKDLKNHTSFSTKYGLKVISVKNPERRKELEKHEGEYWLDIPIGPINKPLGKLTINWEEGFKRDHLDLVELFIKQAIDFIETKQKQNQEIEIITSEKIIDAWLHNLATRLVCLPIVLAKYRTHERQTGELKAVNKDFQRILTETFAMIQRVKETLVSWKIELTDIDLAEQVESVLSTTLPERAWQFDCAERPFIIKADGKKLNVALLEMIQNSREIVGDDEKLRVKVSLTNGDGWAKLTYRDNGPGVPDEFKVKIFDEFFSRRPGEEPSTGLG
ncbi:MAG: GAF domain-containing protein, partial [Acidobacteria bacterium]|nr:GAF domain-containing protein [Acidobacteriota bacterium]